MKILAAGPWIGEFGHELFTWQAYLRRLSKDYDKVIISSRPGHELIYKDFCTEFIEFISDENNCSCSRNYNTKYDPSIFSKYEYTDLIKPTSHWNINPLYFKYGNFLKEKQYDIVIHARNIKMQKAPIQTDIQYKESRNWSYENWLIVIDYLKKNKLKCCTIGRKNSAFSFHGIDNLLDLSLSDLADIFKSSKLAIGPSSGPMHFASLCGCPHFVWSSKVNIAKYKIGWNPFKTQVTLLVDESWNPKPQKIIKTISEIL